MSKHRKSNIEETPDRWLKCPRCNGRTILFRHRAMNHICRKCGCIFTVDFRHKLVTQVS